MRTLWIPSALGLATGLLISWVDTCPWWDDAGVTAGAILIGAGATAIARVPAWPSAALVAAPILIAELPGGSGVLLAIPFAVAGAVAGAFFRRKDHGHEGPGGRESAPPSGP